MLRGWDYEPGTLNVRKVNGMDGEPKLQMRLDLGLLQMEMNGRPDGRRFPRGGLWGGLLGLIYRQCDQPRHEPVAGDTEATRPARGSGEAG